MNPTPSCSAGSLAAGEQLVGSAPTATAWLALEQDGPWGAKAFTASHLDPEVGRSLETAAVASGVRPVLVRRPGRHADASAERARRVLVAHTTPGATWLLDGTVDDPAVLLDLDLVAAAAGDLEAVRRSVPGLSPSGRTHLLVCTNGRRDVCCAVLGRPVVTATAAARPDLVWEVTHTSGHRFAPTAVLLPPGTLHGRLDGASALRLLASAEEGLLDLEGYRGRSTWTAPGQVAELAVRELTGELGLDALTVRAGRDDSWVVRHIDGRGWRVRVGSEETGQARAESCGKAPLEVHRFVVREVEELGR